MSKKEKMINGNYPLFLAITVAFAAAFDLLCQAIVTVSDAMLCVLMNFVKSLKSGGSRPRFVYIISPSCTVRSSELFNVLRVLLGTLVCILASYVLLDGLTRILNILCLVATVTLVPFITRRLISSRVVKLMCRVLIAPISFGLTVLYFPLTAVIKISKKCHRLICKVFINAKKIKKKPKGEKIS